MGPRVAIVGALVGAIAGATTCSSRTTDAPLCEDGEDVVAADGCNSCSCFDGHWGVTELGCSEGLPPGVRSCFQNNVGDVDPETDGVQVECTVTGIEGLTPNEPMVEVPIGPCVRDGPGWALPSPDVDKCWFVRTDATATGDPIDDVSPECVAERDWLIAIEFEFILPPDFSWDEHAFFAACTRSNEICPGAFIETE